MTRNETIPQTFLWRIEIRVPRAAVGDFEAALEPRCASVSSFMLDDKPAWMKDRLYTWHGIYGPLFDWRKK